MTEYLIVGAIGLIILVIVFFVGKNFGKLKAEFNKKDIEKELASAEIQLENIEKNLSDVKEEKIKLLNKTEVNFIKKLTEVKEERENYRREKELYKNELTRKNVELENLQLKHREQKSEVEELQQKFQKEFENLANKILDQKSEKFTLQNKENLQHILNPLKEKIKIFEEKVDRNSENSLSRHAELGKQLQILNEQNLKISEEANNLTKALKGESKTQGNWGELILERVLEKSGLTKNREYFIQKSYQNEDGNKVVPDVVIHLPNDKKMVIDAKVSLRAYEKYVNEENPSVKEKYLKDHLKALNNHILQLSQKKYEDLHELQSPDFVLMFIPVEPALYLAQNLDNSFFYTAFQKNILLVSPTTLLSTLRTIDTIWSNEKQQQNAREIAKHAASLYHKFQNLLSDLKVVGDRLSSTSGAYEDAMKKLTGKQNLIKDIHKLEKLGISPKTKIEPHWLKKADIANTKEQD